MSSRTADWALALGCAALALALYGWTLLPDAGAPEDAPKFQFLGWVLGTAQPPAYPLYTMLDAAISRVPLGTIAARVNALSALFGAGTVALLALLLRRLGTSRVAAAGGALGLATGAAFWFYSVTAEVYTFAALLLTAACIRLAAWFADPSAGRLRAAATVYGIAVGHHPLLGATLPAVGAAALWRDRTLLGRPAEWIVLLLCPIVGLLPYVYILAATAHGSPYLESQARSLSELFDVLRASRYEASQFAFDTGTLATVRVPAVGALIVAELGWTGIVLAVVGLVTLARRHAPPAILFGGAFLTYALGVAATVGDVRGFLVMGMPLAWGLAGLGLDAVLGRLPTRRGAVALGAVAVAVWSLIAVRTNLPANDMHRDTTAAAFFRHLFDRLPGRVAFVFEDYWTQMMRLYPPFTGTGGVGLTIVDIAKDPAAVREMARQGYTVIAFNDGVSFLLRSGLRFTPWVVADPELATSFRRFAPSDVLVAVGADAPLPVDLALAAPSVEARQLIGRRGSRQILVSTIDGRRVRTESGDGRVVMTLGGAEGFGAPLDVAIDDDGATIHLGARAVLERTPGVSLVMLSARGELVQRVTAAPGAPLRLPLSASGRMAWRLTGEGQCAPVGTAWTDVSAIAADGSLSGFVPLERTMTLDLRGAAGGSPQPIVDVLFGDAVQTIRMVDAPTHVRIGLTPGRRAAAFRVRLGALNARLEARLETEAGSALDRITLCDEVPPSLDAEAVARAQPLPLGIDGDLFFAGGWHGPDRAADGHFRWTSGPSSLLRLPLPEARAYQLELDLGRTMAIAAH